MIKVTVPALAEFLAEATGLPTTNVATVARRLREAGFLSQAGHGRSAAAATAKDAATLLLVAATELPSLHSAVVAAQLIACRPQLEIAGKPDEFAVAWAEAFTQGDEIPDTPIAMMERLIARREETNRVVMTLRSGVSLDFLRDESGDAAVTYRADEIASFRAKLGGRPGAVSRQHIIDGRVLIEIADFLGIEAEGIEAA